MGKGRFRERRTFFPRASSAKARIFSQSFANIHWTSCLEVATVARWARALLIAERLAMKTPRVRGSLFSVEVAVSVCASLVAEEGVTGAGEERPPAWAWSLVLEEDTT